MEEQMKFCKHCGGKIPSDAVICTLCGRQVEALQQSAQPNIVINNSNNNSNRNVNVSGVSGGRARSKWTAVLLCFFLGFIGAHKFYEGRFFIGIVYILTFGLLGFGVLIDFIILLFKPNPYYV